MPKSKNRKNHKQKVNARRVATKNEKSRNEKAQREFIMNLIKQEQEKGMFENNATLAPVGGPSLDGPIIEGPSI